MALVNARYLIANSANNRAGLATVRARLEPLVLDRLVATCGVIDLEALFSARSPNDYVAQAQERRAIFEYVEAEESDFELALDIQAELAAKSQHRSGKIPDMLMAAIAIRNDLRLPHYDSDFELIAAANDRLEHEWIVPRGSVD